MRSRDHFSLLVVRGDGARVVRFNFTRPVAVGTFVGLAFAISVVGALARDWTQLRELTREARTFARQIADQRETIDSFNRRAAELRQEMMGWRELHARIWEPFGPELVPGARDKGIGGGATKLPDRLSPKDEVERLAESVTEQGEHLRALDRLMARAGKAVAALPSRWPVRGSVNSEFGNRLSHGQDVRSLYGHLAQTAVKQGERVERGQVIGYSGNTGRSSGPHLHYEIMVKGQSVNPRAYLWN